MPKWDRTLALAVAFCNANPTISLTTNKECYSKRYQFGNNPFVSLRADNLFNKMMFGLSQGLCYFLLSRFHLHALRTYSSASLFFSQVRAIGMASPELLQLVENCPTGAETLIARILNIITDKGNVFFFICPIFYSCKHTVNCRL